jgi:hypothetical protein
MNHNGPMIMVQSVHGNSPGDNNLNVPSAFVYMTPLMSSTAVIPTPAVA